MKNLVLCSALSIFFLNACTPQASFKTLPEGPVKHQYIVAARSALGVNIRGFSDAVPAGSEVYFEAGSTIATPVVANSEGAFLITLPDASPDILQGELHVRLPNKKTLAQAYTIKNLDQALKQIAHSPLLNTPPEVSYLTIDSNYAYILSSEAALVRKIAIAPEWTLAESATATILLNPHLESWQNPRTLATNAKYTVTTLFNPTELSLIDWQENKLLDNYKITNTKARSAERVIALDEANFLVSFINFDNAAQKITGAGIVALVGIANNTLKVRDFKILPYKNPYAFKKNKALEIWVSCTGAFDLESRTLRTTDAGMVKLQVTPGDGSIKIQHQIAFSDFTPAEFDIIGNNLVIPEYSGNKIVVLKEDAAKITPQDYKTAEYMRAFEFTLAAHWHDDIFMLADVSGDLIAYSLSEGYFPFPFKYPIVLENIPDPEIKFGPSQVLMRSQENYIPGYNAWVISNRQQKIIPLDFLELFGP
jgi:hypothetical protein